MRTKSVASCLLLFLTVTLSGCGYTNQTVLPHNIKTVYVDTVRNAIPAEAIYAYIPGMEMKVTNAVIRRFQIDGNLRIVTREEADAVLEMTMIGFEQEGLRFDNIERPEEYRLFIVLSMELLDGQTGEVILEEPSFSGDAEYFVSDVPAINAEEAADRAVKRLARNIVDRIVEDW